MRAAIACLAPVLLVLLLPAQEARSVWDGVFTEAQADRGKVLYGRECASCHGDTWAAGSLLPRWWVTASWPIGTD